jgi:hypothetical protein
VVVDVASVFEDVEASTINIPNSFIEKDEHISKQLRPLPLAQSYNVPSSNISPFEL